MVEDSSISWVADTEYPISTALVKSQLRLIESDFDALIDNLHLPAAVQWAESVMRRSILTKVHTWTIRAFPVDIPRIRLPRGKCSKVESIVYIDGKVPITLKGATSTIPGTAYQEDLGNDSGGLLMPPQGGSWPFADIDAMKPIVITFSAGWAKASVPADIQMALAQYVSDALFVTGQADVKDSGWLSAKELLLSNWTLRGF